MTRDVGLLDDTVPNTPLADSSGARIGNEPTAPHELPRQLTKYRLGALIGRGGMGEVLAGHDETIGRDVAIKRMREVAPSDESIARFLREAKIQARLDHPAIVPVYELGHDLEGRPYFTMKRLAGVTLSEKLAGDPVQRLLRAFADVCLAIALAHSRGIIHRDLKPANIMLGDFGEVYVLDWGLARVLGVEDPVGGSQPSDEDLAWMDSQTRTGDLLGTPGYMAPEQLLDAASAKGAADIYSLGAILFEILTGEPLHPRGGAALATTLGAIECSPARRSQRTIAPELDALCISALATDPAMRPSAPELAHQVQAYLDGDRDDARRRTLAAQELAAAYMALAADRRADAMHAAGRAMAFDPDAGGAELVTRLMIEPPREPPAELQAALRQANADAVQHHAFSSFLGYLGVLACVPMAIWNGVRSWPVVVSISTLAIVLAVTTFAMARRPHRRTREMMAYFGAVSLMIPLVGRLCGPLILAPGFVCLIIWAAMMYPQLSRRPWMILTITMAGWIGPIVLEQLGVLAPTWSLEHGAISSTSSAIEIGGTPTLVFVFGATLLTILIATFHAASLSRANLDAQQRLVTQSWHLQQLLPKPHS